MNNLTDAGEWLTWRIQRKRNELESYAEDKDCSECVKIDAHIFAYRVQMVPRYVQD